MITETGRVVAIDEDGLWVQTIRKSACAQCSAQKGCGQAVLAKMGRDPGFIKVLFGDQPAQGFQLDDFVTIGIGEDVLVKSTLLIYLVPLFTLLLGVLIGAQISSVEAVSAIAGFAGLVVGGLVTKIILSRGGRNSQLQPILLGLVSKPEFWPQSSHS